MNDKIKILCITGPTASGKTALSIKLAENFSGEIVSADSMQIYKGISIASAAPSDCERKAAKHHLIEILSPSESFTVADFTARARSAINDISKRGKLPIVTGGTGLYINALIDNIRFSGEGADGEKREKLEREFDDLGAEAMLKRLYDLDEKSAQSLNINDRRRIIRALELAESGMTKSRQNELSKTEESPYIPLMIGLTYSDRSILYDRINRRIDIMLQNGLPNEARKAYDEISGGAAQAIGHKEFFPYFEGEISMEEATENLKRATRRYAKRQLTWFRRDPRIHWIYADLTPDVYGEAINIIKKEEFL